MLTQVACNQIITSAGPTSAGNSAAQASQGSEYRDTSLGEGGIFKSYACELLRPDDAALVLGSNHPFTTNAQPTAHTPFASDPQQMDSSCVYVDNASPVSSQRLVGVIAHQFASTAKAEQAFEKARRDASSYAKVLQAVDGVGDAAYWLVSPPNYPVIAENALRLRKGAVIVEVGLVGVGGEPPLARTRDIAEKIVARLP